MSNESVIVRHLAALGQRAPSSALPLLRELADLKRVRSAGRQGSTAERLFADAWGRIAVGQGTTEVAGGMLFDALAATRLGDLDPVTLADLGIPNDEVMRIRESAVRQAGESVRLPWLRPCVNPSPEMTPSFVSRLAAQPRAGATCPGRGRLVLEPPESHADHCAMVALFGLILAAVWDACPETVFLAALSHHLHNALMPDAGFAGETALGSWLEPAMAHASAQALAELPSGPRARVEQARRILPDVGTAEGQAFHAADTIDRVLQVEHHLRAGTTSMSFVLGQMELVHAGPAKPFQDAVLQTMGLAA